MSERTIGDLAQLVNRFNREENEEVEIKPANSGLNNITDTRTDKKKEIDFILKHGGTLTKKMVDPLRDSL